MSEEKVISWNEAIDGGDFIKLEEDKPRILKIVNWRVVEVEKEFSGKTEIKKEFKAEVIADGSNECKKEWTTTSDRLKLKLRAVLENKDPAVPVTLRVTKIGKEFNTQYSIQLE